MNIAEKRDLAIAELLEVAADPDEVLDAITEYACAVVAERLRAAAAKVGSGHVWALELAAKELEAS